MPSRRHRPSSRGLNRGVLLPRLGAVDEFLSSSCRWFLVRQRGFTWYLSPRRGGVRINRINKISLSSLIRIITPACHPRKYFGYTFSNASSHGNLITQVSCTLANAVSTYLMSLPAPPAPQESLTIRTHCREGTALASVLYPTATRAQQS